MNNLYWIGIDPGTDGGAVCQHDNPTYPPYYFEMGGNTRESAYDWLRRLADRAEGIFAVLEEIQPAIFGVQKASMSKLYGSFAEWRAFLIACGVPHEVIPARTWLRGFPIEPRKKGESVQHWKVRHRDCARALYKSGSISTSMSDAYLLAEVCCRSRSVGTGDSHGAVEVGAGGDKGVVRRRGRGHRQG